MEDLGTVRQDSGTGGWQPKGLEDVFRGGGTGSVAFSVRGVGADLPYGTGPGNLTTQGCKVYTRETSKETQGGCLGIPTGDGSDVGGRL